MPKYTFAVGGKTYHAQSDSPLSDDDLSDLVSRYDTPQKPATPDSYGQLTGTERGLTRPANEYDILGGKAYNANLLKTRLGEMGVTENAARTLGTGGAADELAGRQERVRGLLQEREDNLRLPPTDLRAPVPMPTSPELMSRREKRIAEIDAALRRNGIEPPPANYSVSGLTGLSRVASSAITGKPLNETNPSAVAAMVNALTGTPNTFETAQADPSALSHYATGIAGFAEPDSLANLPAITAATALGVNPKLLLGLMGAPVAKQAVSDIAAGNYGAAAGDVGAFLTPLALQHLGSRSPELRPFDPSQPIDLKQGAGGTFRTPRENRRAGLRATAETLRTAPTRLAGAFRRPKPTSEPPIPEPPLTEAGFDAVPYTPRPAPTNESPLPTPNSTLPEETDAFEHQMKVAQGTQEVANTIAAFTKIMNEDSPDGLLTPYLQDTVDYIAEKHGLSPDDVIAGIQRARNAHVTDTTLFDAMSEKGKGDAGVVLERLNANAAKSEANRVAQSEENAKFRPTHTIGGVAVVESGKSRGGTTLYVDENGKYVTATETEPAIIPEPLPSAGGVPEQGSTQHALIANAHEAVASIRANMGLPEARRSNFARRSYNLLHSATEPLGITLPPIKDGAAGLSLANALDHAEQELAQYGDPNHYLNEGENLGITRRPDNTNLSPIGDATGAIRPNQAGGVGEGSGVQTSEPNILRRSESLPARIGEGTLPTVPQAPSASTNANLRPSEQNAVPAPKPVRAEPTRTDESTNAPPQLVERVYRGVPAPKSTTENGTLIDETANAQLWQTNADKNAYIVRDVNGNQHGAYSLPIARREFTRHSKGNTAQQDAEKITSRRGLRKKEEKVETTSQPTGELDKTPSEPQLPPARSGVRRKKAETASEPQGTSLDKRSDAVSTVPTEKVVPSVGFPKLTAIEADALQKAGTIAGVDGTLGDIKTGGKPILTPAEQTEVLRRLNDPRFKMEPTLREKLKTKLSNFLKSKEGEVGAGLNIFRNPPGSPTPPVNAALKAVQTAAADFRDEMRDNFISQLSGVDRRSKAVGMSGRRVVGSKPESTVIMRGMMQVFKSLGSDTDKFEEFGEVLVESRLHGLERRWKGASNEVAASGNDKLSSDYVKPGGWRDLTEKVDQALKARRSILKTADFLAATAEATGDYTDLRGYLADVFSDAAKQVAAHYKEGGKWYNSRVDRKAGAFIDQQFQQALEVYKRTVEKPLSENHAQNDGIFSQDLGDLNTYIPLFAETASGNEVSRGVTSPKATLARPDNPANRMATGLQDKYLFSMERFADHAARALRANNQAAFVGELLAARSPQGDAYAIQLSPNSPVPDTITIDGIEVKATAIPASRQRVIIVDGKPVASNEDKILVPSTIAPELKDLLSRDYAPETMLQKIGSIITKIALVGPFDAVFHTANLISGMTFKTPIIGVELLRSGGKFAKAVNTAATVFGNTPFTKVFASMYNGVFADIESENAQRELLELARLGALPPKYGTETYSKTYAQVTGAKRRRLNISPALYGAGGLDARARLTIYRAAKAMMKIAPDQSIHDTEGNLTIPAEAAYQLQKMVNTLGQYHRELKPKIVRFLADAGFSPFATAHDTFVKNGTSHWMGGGALPNMVQETQYTVQPDGSPPVKSEYWRRMSMKERLKWRVAQQWTGGIVAAIAAWYLTQWWISGKRPEDDADARFNAITLPDSLAETALAKMLYGSGRGKKYVSLNFFNPNMGRGFIGKPVADTFNLRQSNADARQEGEKILANLVNSANYGAGTSPIANSLAAAFGIDPYLVDLSATGNPTFLPANDTKRSGGEQLRSNLTEAALNLNPLLQDIAASQGIGYEGRAKESDIEKYQLFRMVTDMAFPRLIGGIHDSQRTKTSLTADRMKTLKSGIIAESRTRRVEALKEPQKRGLRR